MTLLSVISTLVLTTTIAVVATPIDKITLASTAPVLNKSAALDNAILGNYSQVNQTVSEPVDIVVAARTPKKIRPGFESTHFTPIHSTQVFNNLWNETARTNKPKENDLLTIRPSEIEKNKIKSNGWSSAKAIPEVKRSSARTTREYSGYDTSSTDLTDTDTGYGSTGRYTVTGFGGTGTPDSYTGGYSQRGQFGAENYNSISAENYNNDFRNFENTGYYSGSQPWPPRGSIPTPPTPSYFPPYRPNGLYPFPYPYPTTLTLRPVSGTRGHHHHHSTTLISIFSNLGSSLWQLFQIGLGSSLTFVLPLLFFKLILIPLKIFKFLKIIKIILKLFFVVPFLLRIFMPHGLGSHSPHMFASKTDAIGLVTESRHTSHDNSTPTWWIYLTDRFGDLNGTSEITSELRECPSKIACEFGSFLTHSINAKLPDKLAKYLAGEANDYEESGKEFRVQRTAKEEVMRAFVTALGKRWSYEQCNVYSCSLTL